jgi:hypothetical protein
LVTRRALRGHERILIDSSVWVYHFEQHAEFGPAAGAVIEAMEEGAFRGIASGLTLLELTVEPFQLGPAFAQLRDLQIRRPRTRLPQSLAGSRSGY